MLTDDRSGRWHPATRVAFRFCFVYFSLYVVMTQMLAGLLVLPVGHLPDVGRVMNGIVAWTGSHVFHVVAKPTVSGSGDKMYDWVQVFCLMYLSLAAAVIWSVVDRKRDSYERLNRWFRVFMRFALGSTMLEYGFSKAIPLQMPAPPLTRLLEPYGNFSPMGVLWYSIGASFPYERFVGCVEVLGGALLFVPRTAMLGALILLGATIEVFMLNMTYDVPVKLFSFHLVLMSAFLLAPDVPRLAGHTFSRGARKKWAVVVQVVFGLYLLSMGFNGARHSWTSFGWGAPKPALYGIWVIDQMKIDGITRAPLVNDYARWRRVVIQRTTDISFWRMDDTFFSYNAKTDMEKRVITLSKSGDPAWTAQLTFDRPAADRLILDGAIDGHAIHMDTQLFPREKFLLVNRGFHWVQELPFNR